MAGRGALKLTGYCTRCGGDGFDDGERMLHRCPPKRPEADAIVALKFAVDELQSVIDRRPWAAIVRKEDCADLLAVLKQTRDALSVAYPHAAGERAPQEVKR